MLNAINNPKMQTGAPERFGMKVLEAPFFGQKASRSAWNQLFGLHSKLSCVNLYFNSPSEK